MILEKSKERLERDKIHVNHFPLGGVFASKCIYVTADQDDLMGFYSTRPHGRVKSSNERFSQNCYTIRAKELIWMQVYSVTSIQFCYNFMLKLTLTLIQICHCRKLNNKFIL